MSPVTLGKVRADATVKAYVSKADESLERMGFTEHGERHCRLTAKTAARVLRELGRPERVRGLPLVGGLSSSAENALDEWSRALLRLDAGFHEGEGVLPRRSRHVAVGEVDEGVVVDLRRHLDEAPLEPQLDPLRRHDDRDERGPVPAERAR